MDKKISKVMLPHVKYVLRRDQIPFTLREDQANEANYIISLDVSNKRFTEIMEDALCEKQRLETNSNTPVYSLRTLKNKKKRNRLMHLNQKKGFHILSSDMEKYLLYA